MSRSRWQNFDAYLFDLDGTLVDTAPDINAALNHSLTLAGYAGVDLALTRHWVGFGSRMLLQQALQHYQLEDAELNRQTDKMLPEFLAYYSQNLARHSQLYPTVESTLIALHKRGAKLAVVTNKLTQLSEPLLEQIGLMKFFDLVVCGDTAAAPKPDPAPVQYCLDKFELSPQQALFVGDSDTDVNAANAAGVPVVCVADGYNHGVDVATLKVDGVIQSFAELL